MRLVSTESVRAGYSMFAVMFLSIFAAAGAQAQAEDVTARLLKMDRPHPRLLLTDEGIGNLKETAQQDETLRRYMTDVLKLADETVGKPPLEYKVVGPRLLAVSRACLDRVYPLALAWRWTGERRYAEALEANLLTVCRFPDWNPSHFLDTAEMSHAVAIGYDWLYDEMDPASREEIRKGLINLGLEPGIEGYEKGAWWVTSAYNWNQVCNSGLLIGALAVYETDPTYAERIVPKAVEALHYPLETYAPDGVWPEGPSYWAYATRYTAYGLSALQTCLDTDFGLTELPGMAVTGYYPLHTTGPTGLYFNFADAGEHSRRKPMPCLFWLAGIYDNPDFAQAEHNILEDHAADALHVVWYPGSPKPGAWEAERDRYFRGSVEVVTMRSAWNDPGALFVAAKAGFNQVNHGQLDLGNFVFDAEGVRWARDLGSDDYNLPGYWDKKSGGKRWEYYRLNSQSHNVILPCGNDQSASGTASVQSFESTAESATAVLDLSNAYGDAVARHEREVALMDGRSQVRIRDTITLSEPCSITWGMTTDAEITLEEGRRAVLRQDGEALVVVLAEGSDGAFAVESAAQDPPQRENKGVRRLVVHSDASKKEVVFDIVLKPVE